MLGGAPEAHEVSSKTPRVQLVFLGNFGAEAFPIKASDNKYKTPYSVYVDKLRSRQSSREALFSQAACLKGCAASFFTFLLRNAQGSAEASKDYNHHGCRMRLRQISILLLVPLL